MMRDFKSGDRFANTNENNNSSKHLRNGDASSSQHVSTDCGLEANALPCDGSACHELAAGRDGLATNGLGSSPPAHNGGTAAISHTNTAHTTDAMAAPHHPHSDSKSRKKSANKHKLVSGLLSEP